MFKENLRQKANFTFYQILAIGIGFLALLSFSAWKLYPKLLLFPKILLGQMETICGCTDHLSFSHHPILFISLTIIGSGLIGFFGFATIKVLKVKLVTNKFVRENLQRQKPVISRRLSMIAVKAGLAIGQIIEISDKNPVIFCFGLLRSKVCLSSGLIAKMSAKELKAVLLHEQYHLLSHEPIKIFMVKLIAGILFFMPGLKFFAGQYLIFSELAADQWATDNFQNKIPLAGALYKVIDWKKKMIVRNELALSFFANPAIIERVNKLSDNRYDPKFKFFSSRLAIGIIILAISFIFAGRALSVNNSAMTEYYADSCSEMEPILYQTNQQCEMTPIEPICVMDYELVNSQCKN